MNVVFSSSDLYAKCTGIAIYSLLTSNKHIEMLNIYLITTDMTNSNQQKIKNMCISFGRNIKIIEATEILKAAQNELALADFKGGLNTYVRAMANKIMPSDVKRALFVDSDLMFTGSIEEIEKLEMGNNVIAGVPEIMLLTKSVCYEDEELLEACKNYVNYGVVYINLENWRKLDGDKKIKECVVNAKNPFKIAEQSIMNLTFKDHTMIIPVKYNYYTILHGISYKNLCKWYQRRRVFSENELQQAENNPIIIHFVGDYFNRPWYNNNICRFKDTYMEYYLKSPWGNEPLDSSPEDFSVIFKVYYSILIFLRKNYFDTTYFKLRYIVVQWFRERIPGIDKIRRKV